MYLSYLVCCMCMNIFICMCHSYCSNRCFVYSLYFAYNSVFASLSIRFRLFFYMSVVSVSTHFLVCITISCIICMLNHVF